MVGSVERFLTRLQGLAQSDAAGAAAAYQALVKKGLTDELQAQVAALVAEAKQEPAPHPAPPAAAAAIAAATQAQQEAYEQVNLWYQDWAETLRAELPYHEALRVGIVSVRGSRRAPEEPQAPAPTP